MDSAIEPLEFAGKEVIGRIHKHEAVVPREGCDKRFDLVHRTVFVVAPVDKEFWFGAPAQERKIGVIDGNSQADEMRNARMFTADAQTHPGAKAKTRQQQGHAGKFGCEEVESRAHIALLAVAPVMFAGAQPCAAKIES